MIKSRNRVLSNKDKKYASLLIDMEKMVEGDNEVGLKRLIQEANNCYLSGEFNQPLFHWFIASIEKKFQLDKKEVMNLVLFNTLFREGLKYQFNHIKLEAPIVTLARAGNFSAVKYLIEYMKLKIDENEALHPLFIVGIEQHKTMFSYLVQQLGCYSPIQDTVFTLSARYGDFSLMKKCYSMGYVDIDSTDKNGWTPLMHACVHQHPDIIEWLLEKGAQIDIKTSSNQTIAHLIFEATNQDWVDFFLRSPQYQPLFPDLFSTSATAKDNQGLFPIHYAIKSRRKDWVQTIMERVPDLQDVTDEKGCSLLFHAVMADDLPILEYLHVTYHLPLDVRDNSQYALIDYCLGKHGFAIPDWLKLQKSVVFYPSDPNIFHPIIGAISLRKEMIRWFLQQEETNLGMTDERWKRHEHSFAMDAFRMLIEFCHFDLIIEFDLFRKNKHLLRREEESQNVALDSYIASTLFCETLHPEVLESAQRFMNYIIKCLPECLGTPYPFFSYYHESISMIEFCLDYGILMINDPINTGEPVFHALESDINLREKRNYKYYLEQCATSELYRTHFGGKYESSYAEDMLKMIKTYNPDLNVKDSHGEHLFAKLVKLGPDGVGRIQWMSTYVPSIKLTNLDAQGSSLLHLACVEEDVNLVTWCIEKKVLSVSTKRQDGKNALDIALLNGHYDISEFLFKQLVDKSRRNYLSGLCKPNEHLSADDQSKIIEQLKFNRFYGWFPTLQQFSKLPEKIKTCFPDLIMAAQAALPEPQVSDVCVISESVAQDSVSLPPPQVKTEQDERFEFSLEQLKSAILQNHVKWLRMLKRSCKKELTYANALDEMLKEQFFEVICLAIGEKKYRIFYQLLRIDVVQKNMLLQLENILPYVIKRGQLKILSLLIKKTFTREQFIKDGFALMSLALKLGNINIFMVLLTIPELRSLAHEENNALLRMAALHGFTEVIHSLLTIPRVFEQAAVCNNEALQHAMRIEDEESCYLLLQVPSVSVALATNDYEIVRRAIDSGLHVFVHLFAQIPHVFDYLSKSNVVYDLDSLPSTQLIYTAPLVYFGETEFIAEDIYFAILSGDLYALSEMLMQRWDGEPQVIKSLAIFALYNRQIPVMYWLIEADPTSSIKSHLGFCNALIQKAIWMGLDDQVVSYLLKLDPIGKSHSKYNNRLLELAIRYQRPSIALSLLENPFVRDEADMHNNYVLRHAARLGFIEVVEKLLTIDSVRKYATIINNEAFRRAFLAGHQHIVMLLLTLPSVFERALSQGLVYKDPIIAAVTNMLMVWMKNKLVIDTEKELFISQLESYVPARLDPVIQSLIKGYKEQNSKPSVLRQLSMFEPVDAAPQDTSNPAVREFVKTA